MKIHRIRKYKMIKKWRKFRDECLSLKDESLIKIRLWDIGIVKSISIQHGWTTWVTVELNNGQTLIENKFWVVDSLKNIVKQIYSELVNGHST